jgi:hypothetical protein
MKLSCGVDFVFYGLSCQSLGLGALGFHEEPSVRELRPVRLLNALEHRFRAGNQALSYDAARLRPYRAGPGCLNRFSAPISGASSGIRPPRGWRKIEVGLILGCVVKARMGTGTIVKVEILTNRTSRLTNGFVGYGGELRQACLNKDQLGERGEGNWPGGTWLCRDLLCSAFLNGG